MAPSGLSRGDPRTELRQGGADQSSLDLGCLGDSAWGGREGLVAQIHPGPTAGALTWSRGHRSEARV